MEIGSLGASVAVTEWDDHQIVALNEGHHAALLGDAARPRTLQHVLEGFRLAQPLVWMAKGVLNDPVDARENMGS